MKGEKGFTLVEVILAIGIFAIVAIPIISVFLDGIKITSKSENTSEAYAYAQQYVEKLKGGEIAVEEKEEEIIPSTEYIYSIVVNSKTEVVQEDGEDFYKYMNETESEKLVLKQNGISYNGDWIGYDNIKSIQIKNKVDEYGKGIWNFEKITGASGGGQGSFVSGPTAAFPSNKDIFRSWIDYSELTEDVELAIENISGKPLNIYLQSTEENKNNLKIKNLEGIINVYGPVVKTTEEIQAESRGRKKTANVTVTVKNTRTGEKAELTANVTYYDVDAN